MHNARFLVEFHGDAPDKLKVGDELEISGRVWVKMIDADAIDITSYGAEGMVFVPGELTITVLSESLDIRSSVGSSE